jgi:hypothetical protein
VDFGLDPTTCKIAVNMLLTVYNWNRSIYVCCTNWFGRNREIEKGMRREVLRTLILKGGHGLMDKRMYGRKTVWDELRVVDMWDYLNV